jgi:ParB/RepB/Spo0J family partition protein
MPDAPVRASDIETTPQFNSGVVSEQRPMTEQERLDELHTFPTGTKAADAVSVPVSLLRPAKKNPRRGAVAEVIESLREFGQHRPVVVQHSTGQVIVGNHMLKAAKQLGWEHIDALIVDDTDEVAMRRAIADNAVGENETDWNWLQTRLELRREKSYKSEAVATSHVITVERLQQILDG